MQILDAVDAASLRSDIPAFAPGDTVKVHVNITETEQLQLVLTSLLHEEQRRAPFRVRAVEQRATVTLGPLTLNIRIDRVDELADGTIAIIDYKTGERATSADWFGARLRDAQVPLYASQSAAAVGAGKGNKASCHSDVADDSRAQQIQSKGADCNYRGDFSIRLLYSAE